MEYKMEPNLAELIYEPVDDNYGWGKYGDFKVLIRKKDGYINATKLCTDGGKRFDNWLANAKSESFLNYLKSVAGISGELLEKNMAGPYDVRGTYAHPDLIPHIASWVSVQFAFKVSRIVNDYVLREHKREIARQKVELGEKQNTIDDLMAKMDQNTEMLKNLTLTNQQQSEELKSNAEMLKDLTILNYKQSASLENQDYMLDVMNENLVESMAALHTVSDKSVPVDHIPDRKTEQLVIVYTGDDNYEAIRAQKNYVQTRINSLLRANPTMRVISKLPYHPNARELWMAVRAILISEPGIQVRGTKFTMPADKEDWLIEQLNACNNEKYDELNNAEDNVAERTEAAVKTARDLMSMKMDELKNICRENGMKGWSRLNKAALANFIIEESK